MRSLSSGNAPLFGLLTLVAFGAWSCGGDDAPAPPQDDGASSSDDDGDFELPLGSAGSTSALQAQLYVEYFRDNLFLGLAYHRVGCLTDWSEILSDQDYDGFTSSRYCYNGNGSRSVPNAEWFAFSYATGKPQLDACGAQTNERYDTPNYAERSSTCNYNVLYDCNSDCWIRAFGQCQGMSVPIASPCWQ